MDSPRTFTFHLGVHRPQWLASPEMRAVPLFLSYRQMRALQDRTRLAPAETQWCLDSGGFTELSTRGRWTVDARRYAEGVRRFQREVGRLQWAAVMDWMTEPTVRAKTGLSVAEHQRRTVDSYLELRSLAPEVPWAPVLQGWAWGDHMEHVEMYARRGVDLRREAIVGVGSVCRRQSTLHAGLMLAELAELGISLHAFGFKTSGLTQTVAVTRPFGIESLPFATPGLASYARVPLWTLLRSADSMAWSVAARMNPQGMGCVHRSCQNCPKFARLWRVELLERLGRAVELQAPESNLPRWPTINLE